MVPSATRTGRRASKVWRDPRTVVGASDAGAHLDFLATFNYSTAMLGKAVRERGLLPIEEAIHMLTDVPARLYGLHGTRPVAGRLARRRRRHRSRRRSARRRCGCASTCPTGAPRLFGGADGIDHVLVNGTEIVDHGEFTDARPGTLLRSGRDTETVTAS